MGTSVRDRVRKFRAKVDKEEMRALNRVYQARFRIKKQIKHLTEEKELLAMALSPVEQEEVDDKTLEFKAHLLRKNEGRALNEDEQREADLKVLKHENKVAKKKRKERLKCLYTTNEDIFDDGTRDALTDIIGL